MMLLNNLIASVGGRHFLLSRTIPRAGYLSKDTYTGSMHITDWFFTREPADHWDLCHGRGQLAMIQQISYTFTLLKVHGKWMTCAEIPMTFMAEGHGREWTFTVVVMEFSRPTSRRFTRRSFLDSSRKLGDSHVH